MINTFDFQPQPYLHPFALKMRFVFVQLPEMWLKESLNVVICLELRTFLLKEIPFIRQTGGDMVGM